MQSDTPLAQGTNVHQWRNNITAVLVVDQHFPLVVEICIANGGLKNPKWQNQIQTLQGRCTKNELAPAALLKFNILPSSMLSFSRKFNISLKKSNKDNTFEQPKSDQAVAFAILYAAIKSDS